MDSEETTLPPPAPRLHEGMVIDGFLLKQKLHTGGMATLWDVVRADGQPRPGDGDGPLIMKIPRIKGGEDPATIVGFEVEQMVMPVLKGPHVPRFVAKGDFIRQPYIVMEHIPGVSLRPRLDEAPLPPSEVAHIGAQVAVALHALHKQHVVHLDIKPSNILFRPDGTVVLVDFGLSRHDQLPDLLEEEFCLPMGTGPYISPEQVQFVRNDPRSDLFALGVMLYHLSTGERPFGQPNTVSGLRKRLYTDPVPPRTIRPDLPPGCRKSSCAASRSIPTSATRAPPSWPATCSTPSRSRSPSGPNAGTRQAASRRCAGGSRPWATSPRCNTARWSTWSAARSSWSPSA